jgi:H+/Cl- antiporter ClcA
VPVSAAAYGFLKLVDLMQTWFYTSLPKDAGYSAAPTWWPLPLLVVGGLLVGLAIRYLPGTGGHSPADGFHAGGYPAAAELPGVVLAALATLAFGAVLGPEAPLIALGGGLGALAVSLAKRDAPPMAAVVLAAAGSFAAISTLFGSPILGAFLLMEAAGLGGPMLGVVLVPGLLAAGVGSIIFVGLDSLSGFGTFSLTIPGLPPLGHPTLGMFGWALVFGAVAPVVGWLIRSLAYVARARVRPHATALAPVVGLAVGGLASIYAIATGRGVTDVLFSGQTALPQLLDHASSWTVGALVMLMVCKAAAYGLSLSSFRGGPVFPAMFIGAAAGVAVSHLPGCPMVAGAAMGIGAMTTVMLGLPLTAVLLASVLTGTDSISAMPVVIVAVVVAYVVSSRLTPIGAPAQEPAPSG